MSRHTIGLVGVTGYTGMELARLLPNHSSFTLTRVTSRAEAGKRLAEIYPFMQGFECGELVLSQPDAADLARACDLVFLAVPHGTAMDIAGELRRKNVLVVDLSADFRLRDTSVYAQWYGLEHRETGLLAEAVYGLPELYRREIAQATLIANPGCYPTSAILGLYPALSQGVIHADDIVIDAKSGATGAGRKPGVGTLFCEVADSFRAYNLGKHRHTPEIEQEVSRFAGRDLVVSFNTHLLPINRGILSTIYTKLAQDLDGAQIVDLYRRAYAGEPWVRVLDLGKLPETRHVRGTMFCDIGLVKDPRTNRLLIVTAIDNLCRGASGQAMANANLMLGVDQQEGLRLPPLMP